MSNYPSAITEMAQLGGLTLTSEQRMFLEVLAVMRNHHLRKPPSEPSLLEMPWRQVIDLVKSMPAP